MPAACFLTAGLLSAGLLFAGTNSAAAEQQNRSNYIVVPFSLTIFPVLGTGTRTIDNVQINIGAGYCDILNGFSLGFVNLTGEDATGLDLSLLGFTGNNFTGMQFSLAAYTGNDFRGGQFSLANYVGGNFLKAQAGLLNIVAGNFDGFQAGLVDINLGSFKGFQAGLLNFDGGNFSGFQAGLVNIAGNTSGFQIGLVNYADDIDGIPIGLVSIVAGNGQTHAQLYADETGFGNIALINGSKLVYNIYTAGIDYKETYWTYGLGLGVHIPADPFYINMEIIDSAVSRIAAWDGRDILAKIRIYAGIDIFDHLSVIAGVSLNYYYCWGRNPVNVTPIYNASKTFANGGTLWPGIFAGVMF